MEALENCEACLLVLPCGKSAHLELGFACGYEGYTRATKKTAVYAPSHDSFNPELMYLMVSSPLVVLCDENEVLEWASA